MAIRQKTVIQMKINATGETHARSKVRARDVESTIDEPLERDGTNQGLSPTETLMASLIGCTNVITKRIAHGMGVEMHWHKGRPDFPVLTGVRGRGGVLVHVHVSRLVVGLKNRKCPLQRISLKTLITFSFSRFSEDARREKHLCLYSPLVFRSAVGMYDIGIDLCLQI